MVTYVNDLRLSELATGEGSGTWGTTTNTNLELIGEALGYATEQSFGSDADATTTVGDGVSDPARAMYFKVTSAVSLTATRTLTIAPNTVSRVMFIENATSGSQSIAISQGSGANVTIATGKTAIVYLDGAGSGAAVVDAMAGVDPGVTDTLAEVLTAGNATGGTDISVSTGDDITFADSSKAIFGAGSDLEIYHDGSNSFIKDAGTGHLKIQATNLKLQDVDGNNYIDCIDGSYVRLMHNTATKLETTSTGIDVTGTATMDGLTVDGVATISSTIGDSFVLNKSDGSGSPNIIFKSGGTQTAKISTDGTDAITFARGTTTALKIVGGTGDISFYEDTGTTPKLQWIASDENLEFADNSKAIFGAGSDLQIYHDGSNSYVSDQGTGTLKIQGDSQVRLESTAGERYFVGTNNGAARLYYDDTEKLATTDTGIDVTGVITTDGMTTSADVNFGDNDKAIFGADSDLQIYHDGIGSYVEDTGAGNLILKTNGSNIQFRDASDNINFKVSQNQTELYYAASQKLATTSTGINVTGSISADGLTVDSAFEISGASPKIFLSETDTTDVNTRIRNAGGKLQIQTVDDSDSSPVTRFQIEHSTGDISFYEDTGTTPKFFWDASAESLGIGTTSPSTALHVVDTTGDMLTLEANSAASSPNIVFKNNDGEKARINSVDAGELYFGTGASGTERMRIDSSGRVGIGCTPSRNLDIQGTGDTLVSIVSPAANQVALFFGDTDNDSVGRVAYDNGDNSMRFTTNGSEAMRIDSSQNLLVGKTSANFNQGGRGNVEIGGTLSAILALSAGSDNDYIFNDGSSLEILATTGQSMRFFTNGANERMRIDASGNLLVGTASSGVGTARYTVYNDATNIAQILVGQNGTPNGTPLLRCYHHAANSTTAATQIQFLNRSVQQVGFITSTGSATAYNTSSDQRLKENIVDAPSASNDIDAIQVRSFDWKADGSHQKYGMVAQELLEVAPVAVSGDADSDEMMGVDYSKLVPMLVKEIQSLRARVAQLEN